MKTSQLQWTNNDSWQSMTDNLDDPKLIFAFGGQAVSKEKALTELKEKYPNAIIVGCSTAGEIMGEDVFDDTIVATAVRFESTEVAVANTSIADFDGDSFAAGADLANKLNHDELAGVFILSDGLQVNGSSLVKGLQKSLPEGVTISGGLAGDGGKFEKTFTICDGSYTSGHIVAVAFYGSRIQLNHGTRGGWDKFGPVRKISASEGNILKEIDGSPALDLYKKYLGEENSKALPGSALLFPIVVFPESNPEEKVVRTVLAVDEENNTMTFAGDVPEGWCAQLMRANFDNLVDAAGEAASDTNKNDDNNKLALLVSCVGRKMVLGEKTADEVESVIDELGKNSSITGFYSYGEISPLQDVENSCALHNQTMTVTVISEEKSA